MKKHPTDQVSSGGPLPSTGRANPGALEPGVVRLRGDGAPANRAAIAVGEQAGRSVACQLPQRLSVGVTPVAAELATVAPELAHVVGVGVQETPWPYSRPNLGSHPGGHGVGP
jgi:hypothetical protein